jgi:tetratricopeptide (TPR) repeat protein
MIVRNEGKVIRRLLDSVKAIVSEYVIVDTGSTDDTVEKILDYPLPGLVVRHSFVNFGVSRTFALEQARMHSRCDYLLLMDADMELAVGTSAMGGDGQPLLASTADAFYVTQRQGALVYENVRILKRKLDVTCVGATHEHYRLPPGCRVERLPTDAVFIVDHGDGGCKSNKLERDRELLRREIRETPANPRTVFYFAQTLFDMGDHREAIGWYEKRIALGGWEQEVAYSKFRIALCCMALEDWGQAQAWTQLAHDTGGRAEPAYYMCKALREAGEHARAYSFLVQAKAVPQPPAADCLFVEAPVYDYLLDFEQCLLWYYLEPALPSTGMDLSVRFLNNPGAPAALRQCVLSNTVFYASALAAHPHKLGPPRRLFADEFWGDGWRYSSVGFLDDGTPYARVVNYVYREDGTIEAPGNVSRTRLLVGSCMVDDVRNETPWHHPAAPVRGLEDTRVVTAGGAAYTLSASMEYSRAPGVISQVVGKLDVARGTHTVLAVVESPVGSPCEKNWVAAGGLERVVYQWYPEVWVGRVDVASAVFVRTGTIHSPPSFLGMRGSTNGVFFRGMWWFVTHVVVADRGPVRRYTHRLVALDAELTEVRVVSHPFVFEPAGDVEFCLGFRVLPDGTAEFAYSVRDRLPRSLRVPLQALRS